MNFALAPNPYLLTLVGIGGGFATALLAEPVRQWLFRPKLRLGFGDSEDYLSVGPEMGSDGSTRQALYVRVKVVNVSSRSARGCRAYLVGVERKVGAGQFVNTIYCDSIQLAWSVISDRQFSAIDLPPGVPQFIDVISTREGSESVQPMLAAHPFRYADLFSETTAYRLTILVTGDWVRPGYLQLGFIWNGNWRKLDAWGCTFSLRRPRLPG